MKKILLLLITLWTLPNPLDAQQERIAIQDALILARIYAANGNQPLKLVDVEDVLAFYFKDEDIANTLSSNPFLDDYIKTDGTASVSESSKNKLLGASAGSISGLDVTKYAEGLARFMISRAKEELTVSFFERFKKFAAENPEFGALFPETTRTLDRLLSFHYSEMLSALRTAFYEDLDEIIQHLDDVMELEKYRTELQGHPEIRIAVKSIQLFPELESGTSPAEIISGLSKLEEWEEIDQSSDFRNVKPTVKLAHIISQSLRSTNEETTWVNRDSLHRLFRDQAAFDLYVGLVYQLTKKEDITFFIGNGTLPFSDFLGDTTNALFLVKNYLTEFIQVADRIERIKTNTLGRTLEKEDYFNYVEAASDIIKLSLELASLADEDLDAGQFILLTDGAVGLYKNIYFEQYGQAILAATEILYQVSEVIDPANDTKFDDIIDKIAQYGLFMANMIEAKTPEQVESLIESVVLPVGSSSIKKHSSFNISVQSYLGAYYLVDGPSNGFITSWNDDFGVHAPIGVSISTGLGEGGSLSLFGSLLDLGAIVDYQLNIDTLVNPIGADEVMIEKDYKIELGQIFSPGGYLVYGFPCNFPLALGVGGQYGPGLSRIETDGKVIVNDSKWRWNVFLSVDIPFFTISNKRK